MEHTLSVMISSTALDLPKHRRQAMDACTDLGLVPKRMESLPASPGDAISESLALVNQAHAYVGIFGFRYGYVPPGHDISITEMEYNRAAERGIPVLIFLMDEGHSLTAADVEKGEGAQKLEALKGRLRQEKVVKFFRNEDELGRQVYQALSVLRHTHGAAPAQAFVADIPAPPAPYVAHQQAPYQSYEVVGRQDELDTLTEWIGASPARVFSIVAVGGMGKSALAWKCFNDIAPFDIPGLAGRMWWSFQEGEPFDIFLRCALAYADGEPVGALQNLSPAECVGRLLVTLDAKPFLLVLDSLEQVLNAYADSAATMADGKEEQEAARREAALRGLPADAAHSFVGQRRLRSSGLPLVGELLRGLASVKETRTLVTTRLYPAELQDEGGALRPGCEMRFLHSLSDGDALSLWRWFKVGGSRDVLLHLFRTFDNYPKLIHQLAGGIAQYRRAQPDSLERWRQERPDFDFVAKVAKGA